MIQVLDKNLKIKENNLEIPAYFNNTTIIEVSDIKHIYLRKNRFRYFFCAIVMSLLLFVVITINNHFEIIITIALGTIIVYLSKYLFTEILERNILVVKESNKNQNKLIVLKSNRETAKKVVDVIKNIQYKNKMQN